MTLTHDATTTRLRRTAAGLLAAALTTTLGASVVAGTVSPAAADESGTTEGCTPGYWKNHPESWLESPGDTTPAYTPSTPLGTISTAFDTVLPGATFGSALAGRGGTGLDGAVRILARAATASWLNATVEIAFPYRRTQTGVGGRESLRTLVTRALRSGDRDQILSLAATLDRANNLGCPLS